jgi:uncharacterized Tic20 family protein
MNQQQNSILGTDDQPLYTPTSDERTMAILSHILCLVFWLFPPLIIYLVKKDESQYVAAHAKESLNFQLTVMIAVIASVVLMILLIGFLLLWVVGIASMVLIIIATIKASENKLYRYPFTLRLIK